ncbi:hypothetical protein AJ80_09091 [Polytolypa hystricis UAMH7299]|uniref:Uncharacterized protein n=1 Tax=Polytolypa hystricis (strain UAMH7299) TaxID=1447883 RepID=A0A2B7WWF8_POLH7|nr:hypothetical protein AJ80_09091 [Polytolypa hystricis UAMH7299]
MNYNLMAANFPQIPASNLRLEHLAALELALSNVLSTEPAFETFAQVVDGILTRDSYFEYYLPTLRPEYARNLKPSDEASQIVRAFHASFHVGMLNFRVDVAQTYQSTPLGSRSFKPRLIELVSVACHNIAVELYTKADGGLRKPASPPPPPRTPSSYPLMRAPPPNITELFHEEYEEWEQYSNGVADIVRYWAEYRLFGDVILFDRGDTGQECKNAFIHSIKGRRIFQLSDQQIEQFPSFATSQHQSDYSRSFDTRFRAENDARRVDPFDSLAWGMYRDEYERKPPDPRQRRCVFYAEDDPQLIDQIQKLAR